MWEDAYPVLSQYENFYVDTCSSFYALPKETTKKIIDAYGTKKVIFGTDYPMWKQQEDLEYLFDLGLTDSELRTILYNNILKVLRID